MVGDRPARGGRSSFVMARWVDEALASPMAALAPIWCYPGDSDGSRAASDGSRVAFIEPLVEGTIQGIDQLDSASSTLERTSVCLNDLLQVGFLEVFVCLDLGEYR